MRGTKTHHEGIKAISETEQIEDAKSINIPVLIIVGMKIRSFHRKNAAFMQDKLLVNSKLIIYPGYLHGMHTSYADFANKDILKFIHEDIVSLGHNTGLSLSSFKSS